MLEEGKSQWNNQFGTSVSCPKQTRASLQPSRHDRSLCQFFVSLAELMRSTPKKPNLPTKQKAAPALRGAAYKCCSLGLLQPELQRDRQVHRHRLAIQRCRLILPLTNRIHRRLLQQRRA